MKSLFVILFLLITARLTAPDLKAFYIPQSGQVDVYERLMSAIIRVECSGNTPAFNMTEEATGPLQIRPIRIEDYNQRTGKNYLLLDCYDIDVSREIFLYYAKKIGYPNYELIARNWNGSGKMTLDYWNKVKAYL